MRGDHRSLFDLISRTTLGAAFGLAVLCVLAGCDGCNDPATFDGFDVSEVGPASENLCAGAICGDGEICRRDRCTVPCIDDDDCLYGERCTADGYCYPEIPGGDSEACDEDEDCDSRICHEGNCIPPRTCINGAECFADEICSLDGFCVPACTDDSECPADEICVNGGCLAGAECENGDDCVDGACMEGICAESCDPEGPADQCGQDTACSLDGLCEPRCTFHEDCDDGVCVHGVCTDDEIPPLDEDPVDDPEDPVDDRIPECLTNTDCGDENMRCEDGACIPLTVCLDDEDCDDDTYCHRGQCRPFCEVDDDCRGEQTCEEGRCVAEAEDVACTSTEQCEPCESCIYGVCTVSEYFCDDDGDCGIDKLCRNGFCTYECDALSDCPRGQSCIDQVCLDDPPLTGECVFNDECDQGFVCINARCHIVCETHSECGSRQMCDHGICQPDRRPGLECTRSEHCADLGGECVDGYCALACWEDRDCVTNSCESGFCTR